MTEGETLDASRIDFPLDTATWGQIRRFAINAGDNVEGAYLFRELPSGDDVVSGHWHELRLATSAFNHGRDNGEVLSKHERAETIMILHEIYTKFGLSGGKHNTSELVRRFEEVARKQGAGARGPGR